MNRPWVQHGEQENMIQNFGGKRKEPTSKTRYRWDDTRGKSPNMGRCIISYQEVLSSLLKNVNHQADEAVLCNHSINGQFLWTSVLTGRLCFGAL